MTYFSFAIKSPSDKIIIFRRLSPSLPYAQIILNHISFSLKNTEFYILILKIKINIGKRIYNNKSFALKLR
ncbi:MAG: hypothetical protein DBY14_00570 [Escherichia coli]|nr:MAG: hypothetical protein DBY14_00570 [Escherichia coli]